MKKSHVRGNFCHVLYNLEMGEGGGFNNDIFDDRNLAINQD